MVRNTIILVSTMVFLGLLGFPSVALGYDGEPDNIAVARVLRIGNNKTNLSWRAISPQGLPKSTIELDNLFSRIERTFRARANDIYGSSNSYGDHFGVMLRTFWEEETEKYEWTLLKVGGNEVLQLSLEELMDQRTGYRTILDEYDLKSAVGPTPIPTNHLPEQQYAVAKISRNDDGYRSITAFEGESLLDAIQRVHRNKGLDDSLIEPHPTARAKLGAVQLGAQAAETPSLKKARSVLKKFKMAARAPAKLVEKVQLAAIPQVDSIEPVEAVKTVKPIIQQRPIESLAASIHIPQSVKTIVKQPVQDAKTIETSKIAKTQKTSVEAISVIEEKQKVVPPQIEMAKLNIKKRPINSLAASVFVPESAEPAPQKKQLAALPSAPPVKPTPAEIKQSAAVSKIESVESNMARLLGFEGIDLDIRVKLDDVGNGRFALFLPAIEHPLLTGNVQDGKLSNLRKRNLGMGDYRSAVDGIIDELAQKSKQVSIAVADAYKQRTRIANSANTKVLSLLKVEMEKADTLLTKAAKERDRLDLIYEEIDVLFSSKKPKEAYRKAQQLASVSGKANELREYYVAQIKALETIEKSLSSVED